VRDEEKELGLHWNWTFVENGASSETLKVLSLGICV
jgi:hypothetical protein